MAIEKHLLGRIIHKHDIEENWDKATGFIPQQGEIIVYDIDDNYEYERFKIGDGKTTVINLPFQKTNINDLKAVSYDIAQELTDEQKIQARVNIGAGTPDSIKIIEATYYANGESTISSTEEEINALIEEGKNVCIDCFIEPEDKTFRFYFSTKTSSGATLFVNTEISDGAPELKLLTLIGSTFMIITMPVPLRSLATESKDGMMSTEDKVKLDSIEEGAQVNVQSDWNQNDETASDFVKNKPFGNEIVEILPETTIEVSSTELPIATEIELLEGNTYTVHWNGVKYSCVAQKWEIDGVTYGIVVGDLGMITAGEPATGEPFIIGDLIAEYAAVVGAPTVLGVFDGSTSVTLSIILDNIIKLDSKYLDEALQFGETITEILPETVIEQPEFPATVPLAVGNTYTVKFNGAEYDCVCRAYTENDLSGYILGNFDALTGEGDTGEPFCFLSVPDFGACMIMPIDESITSITLSITGAVIKKLDNKYLDLAWTPSRKTATRVEVFPETTVDATGDIIPLTEEFKASAEDKAPYIVTWNGTEYTCNAMLLSNQFVIGNLYLANPDSFPNTGEPFLFFTTGQNVIISYMDEGAVTFKIDRGYYDTLPYEFAPANYTITTDIPANQHANNDGQLSQAEYVLKHGGKVFATVDGRDVEILSMIADTVDNYHNFSWRDRLNGNIYTMPGSETDWKAQTPAVDRIDILLRHAHSGFDDVGYDDGTPPQKFRFTVDENGNLMSSNEDGTNQKKYLTESDGSGLNVPVTSADNGKFLRVVDGAWAASIPEDYVTEEELNNKGYLTQHQSLIDYAKTSEVDTKIANLVNSAPEKLNTLDELAAALGDDENFANTITTELGKKINSSDLASWAKASNKPAYTASEVGAAEAEHTHDKYATKDSPTFTGAFTHGSRQSGFAIGDNSFASGTNVRAIGTSSHAEGQNTRASGDYSHVEGKDTAAYGNSSHAEGYYTTASGNYSHAEGQGTIASGIDSHAEGQGTTASGDYSHAEGRSSYLSQSITGEANTLTYAVNGTMSSIIKPGCVIEYGGIYALITAIDSDNNTITLDKTLSTEALDNVTATIMLGIASGDYSHAEGYNTTASGSRSHAEGQGTIASGNYSHAEGNFAIASGNYSHAEGYNTTASGNRSHAEGYDTIASGSNSHAEGNDTTANSRAQHVQGEYNVLDIEKLESRGTYAHIVGNGISENSRSNAHTLDWNGNAWFQGDVYVGSTSGKNKDEGSVKLATMTDLESLQDSPTFTGAFTHGSRTNGHDVGTNSFASGIHVVASGSCSHAEGQYTTASGNYSHVEGNWSIASGESSHAEGYYAIAFGNYSHAEGNGENTQQSITGEANTLTYTINGSMSSQIKPGHVIEYNGIYALITAIDSDNNTVTLNKTLSTEALDNVRAKFVSCVAYGNNSHAEGYNTAASGNCSHAEGNRTTAYGHYSHAEGYSTTASGDYSHVQGKYNIDDNNYAHIVGNGYSNDTCSNAHTLDWDGNAWFAGDVYVGSTSGTNKDEGSVKLVKSGDKELILTSSTEGSTKKFKITVDDNGVLTTTEVTE